MLRKLSLSVAALAALVSAIPATPTDWDPCQDAHILWNGPTGPFDLSASSLANITTRSRFRHHFSTREHVFVVPGTGEDIVVTVDIKLTDNILQDAVSVVNKDNTVAVIFDGADHDDWHRRECIVASVHVHVPKSLEHLLLDVHNAPIDFNAVSSAFKKLDILDWNGATRIRDSNLDIDTLAVSHHNGAFRTFQSTIKAKTANVETQNGVIAARFAGSPIETLNANSHNGHVDLVIVDTDDSKDDATSKITATSNNGAVGVRSYVKGEIDLQAKTVNGRIITEIYNSKDGGKFHTQVINGHISAEGDVKVTKAQKSRGRTFIEGHYGPGDADASSVDLGAVSGSLSLFVGDKAEDGSNVEPRAQLEEGDGDDWVGEPSHPHHLRSRALHVLSAVAVGVLLSGLVFHLVRRYRAYRERNGYVSI